MNCKMTTLILSLILIFGTVLPASYITLEDETETAGFADARNATIFESIYAEPADGNYTIDPSVGVLTVAYDAWNLGEDNYTVEMLVYDGEGYLVQSVLQNNITPASNGSYGDNIVVSGINTTGCHLAIISVLDSLNDVVAQDGFEFAVGEGECGSMEEWEYGSAIINATTFVDDADFAANSSSWTCEGGVGLMNADNYADWDASGETDPTYHLNWAVEHASEGTVVNNTAPEGDFYVFAGLDCKDGSGMKYSFGGIAFESNGDSSGNITMYTFINGTSTHVEIYLYPLTDTEEYFTCDDGTTIPLMWVNDGFEDCTNGEDETDGGSGSGEITFVCDNETMEIPFSWVNDGFEDCADGSDEPQDFDGDSETDNWFDCADGTTVSMDVVNDGTWDCPDGEDEGEGEGGDDDYEPDCEELSMEMFLEYDAAGDIFFTASSMCYFSQYDSDDMRTMWDQYIGDNDGILNESEANMVLTMMANSSSDDNSSDDDDGNWTIDGALVEMTITETFNGLAETGRISIAFNMVSESIGDDGTGVHTVIYVADTIIDDDNACLKADVISSLDFEPTMVTVTTAFDVIDEGNGSWSIEEIPNSAGECLGEPNTATIVFGAIEDEPTEPEDEIVGSGGGIPGFTSVITVTALLGAVLYLGRRD